MLLLGSEEKRVVVVVEVVEVEDVSEWVCVTCSVLKFEKRVIK